MERDPDMSKTPVGQGDPMADAVDKLADAASVERHAEPETASDIVGESVGGVTGTVAGAAIGALAGPIGAVIGGIAGALGGWWAGRTVSEAVSSFSDEDEYYRAHYDSADSRLADRSYEDIRLAYQLGHVARRNPEYDGRTFDEIESDLERGWTSDIRSRAGEWSRVRPFARDAYHRGHGNESTPRRISEITNAARQKMHDDTTGGGIAP